jgi:hypothetical protein
MGDYRLLWCTIPLWILSNALNHYEWNSGFADAVFLTCLGSLGALCSGYSWVRSVSGWCVVGLSVFEMAWFNWNPDPRGWGHRRIYRQHWLKTLLRGINSHRNDRRCTRTQCDVRIRGVGGLSHYINETERARTFCDAQSMRSSGILCLSSCCRR